MASTTQYDLKIDGKENEHQLLAKMYEAATAIGNEQLSSLSARHPHLALQSRR